MRPDYIYTMFDMTNNEDEGCGFIAQTEESLKSQVVKYLEEEFKDEGKVQVELKKFNDYLETLIAIATVIDDEDGSSYEMIYSLKKHTLIRS